jgi:hypothetical protein
MFGIPLSISMKMVTIVAAGQINFCSMQLFSVLNYQRRSSMHRIVFGNTENPSNGHPTNFDRKGISG